MFESDRSLKSRLQTIFGRSEFGRPDRRRCRQRADLRLESLERRELLTAEAALVRDIESLTGSFDSTIHRQCEWHVVLQCDRHCRWNRTVEVGRFRDGHGASEGYLSGCESFTAAISDQCQWHTLFLGSVSNRHRLRIVEIGCTAAGRSW